MGRHPLLRQGQRMEILAGCILLLQLEIIGLLFLRKPANPPHDMEAEDEAPPPPARKKAKRKTGKFVPKGMLEEDMCFYEREYVKRP